MDESVGVSHIAGKKFWSLSTEKLREHPCNVSEKLWYRDNLCIFGVSRFSVKNFSSDSAKKIVGNPSMFQKIWCKRKILCINGGHTFPLKIVPLTVPKTFIKESYCFWEKFCFRKIFTDERGGVYNFFPLKNFGLTVTKNFVFIPTLFQKNCGIGNFLHIRGLSVFLSKESGLSVPKSL